MISWTKDTVIEFLLKHPTQLLLIEAKDTHIKIQGRVLDVINVDLCSLILQETQLHLETKGVQVVLTFHDDFLGIHCTIQPSEEANSEVFIPYQIPYDLLKLTLPLQ